MPFYVAFFRFYTNRMLKRYFRKIHLETDPFDSQKSILLIANHFSWWDGFIGNYLSYNTYRKKFHVMMLEEQLEKRKFLNKAGAYSVKKHSRSILESLNYSAEILSSPEHMVMMFPQGHFESLYERDFSFARGIGRIIDRSEPQLQIVFNINLVDYFSKQAPTLFIRCHTYQGSRALDDIEKAFNQFHMTCISKQNEQLV